MKKAMIRKVILKIILMEWSLWNRLTTTKLTATQRLWTIFQRPLTFR